MKKILSVILVVLMIISLTGCGGERIVWDDIILGDKLPTPPTNKGETHTNAADDLWLEIKGLSDKQFNDYVEACKEMGFTIDADYDSSSYHAFNAEGYKLSLGHYNRDGDMSIRLDEPMEMTTITWPTSIAGQMVPAPKSTMGRFSYEYEDHFYVYVGNTSRSDYAEYVADCSEKGFHVDYNKGEDYYYAYNSDGWHISIRYEGYNIITIDVDAPKEEDDSQATVPTEQPSTEPSAEATDPPEQPSTEPTSEETTPATEKQEDNSAIDPEFKAAMDSYEAFMDEYVAFMKKYMANPSDLSLLADYADYMSKYAAFVEDFEKWDDEEMNAAETAYYIDVQARVNKKLLEVVQ